MCIGRTRARVYRRDFGAHAEAIGVTHVNIGHSERRQYCAETDDT